ncbi:MAG: DNA polymerase III subunit delta [Patescibacteria group bacterium]|nr:DNA polymerase III subunit delta [Patescibacteria group bacterium]
MIFFLAGPDTFRSRRKLAEIRQKFITEIDQSAINIEALNGELLEVNTFSNAVFTPPFLAKKRLIIVENLLGKNKTAKTETEIFEIINGHKLDDVIIVFWEGELAGKKITKKKSTRKHSGQLLARLKQEKYAIDFPLLNSAAVVKFASAEFARKKVAIEAAAIKLLTDLTGNDLWQLNSEIEKLTAFAQGKSITAAMVSELVLTKLDDDIFKLTDAIAQQQKPLAIKLISDQLQAGTMPTELLAKITWQFRNLLLVRGFIEANGGGYPASRVAYQLGLHPFVLSKTSQQVKNFSLADLKNKYQNLLAIDHKIKTSQADPEVLLDLLVIKN